MSHYDNHCAWCNHQLFDDEEMYDVAVYDGNILIGYEAICFDCWDSWYW